MQPFMSQPAAALAGLRTCLAGRGWSGAARIGAGTWPHCQMTTSAPPHQAATAELASTSSGNAPGDTGARLDKRIGVLGAGQMARALIRSWTGSGLVAAQDICTSDRPEAQRRLAPLGLGAAYPEAEKGGAQQVRPHHLLVSIAAGVTLDPYERSLPRGTRVVRVMPNTPLLVGQGAAACCLGRNTRPEDEAVVQQLLGAGSSVTAVDEEKMDAVTALSGSGPAFVFIAIEALADRGVAAGLPRQQALQLAAQTVLGGAAMVPNSGEGCDGELVHPGVLKDRVASPAGTTIAGIAELEKHGMRSALMHAVVAAVERSRQLSAEAAAETSAA